MNVRFFASVAATASDVAASGVEQAMVSKDDFIKTKSAIIAGQRISESQPAWQIVKDVERGIAFIDFRPERTVTFGGLIGNRSISDFRAEPGGKKARSHGADGHHSDLQSCRLGAGSRAGESSRSSFLDG